MTQNVLLILRGPVQQRPEVTSVDSQVVYSQVVFSPDGSRLAANSWTGKVFVWDGRPLPDEAGAASP